jgi:hypothetical protein
MHKTRPAQITSPIVSLNGGHIKAIPAALISGAIGIGIAIALTLPTGGLKRFMMTYLASYCFVLSIGLGCLFFVTIMHLTRAGWSATVRRIAEIYAMCLLPMGLLFLPILIPLLMGSTDVYQWNDSGFSVMTELTPEQRTEQYGGVAVADRPPIEQLKAAYLNTWFFAGRIIACFAIWGLLAWTYLGNSLKQDQTGDKNITARLQGLAAPFLILFAVTIVFSSFDLEMSLSPLWFSTMFPVYFFAGGFMGALCTILLTGMYLQRTGRVTDEITIDHYHDLGKLMQGFVIFWGYIAFSQFLLIWYANIPEETFWYDPRINGAGWKAMTYVLLIGHLFIPFFLLMGRALRRNRMMLTISAIWLLCLHWLDHYWIVMPEYGRTLGLNKNESFSFTGTGMIADIACGVGMVAIFVALFCLIARDRPLVPLKDPRLGQALNHEVH